jgi:hypothetical protein
MVMVAGAYGDELFARSFLTTLNRETYFGIISDDLIEMIFNQAGIRINYIDSPLSFEIKNNPIELKYNPLNFNYPEQTQDRKLWTTDDNILEYKHSDPLLKIHKLRDFRKGNNLFIFDNFPYEIIKKVKELTPKNMREVYEYMTDMEIVNHSESQYVNSEYYGFHYFKILYSAIHQEELEISRLDVENAGQDFWVETCYEFIDDLYGGYDYGGEERQLRQDVYLTERGLNKALLEYPNKRGRLILLKNKDVDSALKISLHTQIGKVNMKYRDFMSHLNSEDDREIWIEPYEDTYEIRSIYDIKVCHHPYRIRRLVEDFQDAQHTFKQVLKSIKRRRETKIMNILRYAKTGIEPTYIRNHELDKQIHRIITHSCFDNLKYVRYKMSETFIYTANMFRINEFKRLKQLFLKAEDEGEKAFYLMKLGFLMRDDERKNCYSVCNRDICNMYDVKEEVQEKYAIYQEYKFMGCDNDENNYINPKYPTSRISVKLWSKMRYASMNIDENDYWGYDRLDKAYRKYLRD